MIDLKARQNYIYFTMVKRIILTVFAFPITIWGLVMMFLSVIQGYDTIRVPLDITLIFTIVLNCVAIIFMVVDAFYKKWLRKNGVFQFFEIINTCKIGGNPKVLYVYTCHNDLIESRVLQNIQQTYKNMECWISDGSDNDEISNQYKQFAFKNNINYFKVGRAGSPNKASNLNSFLSRYQGNFDYLLITDSDEALDNRFVDYALRCFNCKQFNHLGYVSPLNYCYETKSTYTNVLLNTENARFYKTDYTRTITFSDSSNLYSSSCLISKKVLEANNKRFPDGCLEDIYLENISIINGFVSIILPLTACGQQYDKSVFHHYRKMMRVYDWQIKLVKSGAFNIYNEKFTKWYSRLALYAVLLVPMVIFGALLLPLVCWFIIRFCDKLFLNPYFCTSIGLAIALAIGAMIIVTIDTKNTSNKFSKWTGFYSGMSGLASLPYLIKHWWMAFIRGKYSTFDASNDKTKSPSSNSKPWFITCIVSFVLFIAFIVGYILIRGFLTGGFKLGLYDWWLILFFYIAVYLLIVFLCSFAMCFLIVASNKTNNPDYDESKFVYPPEFYKFKDIEAKYFDSLGDKERIVE